jgi:uncharacterized protein
MRKAGPADYKVMPWKDGGGSTTELRIHPPGATLAGGFLWRLSMAAVNAPGPFSTFPGVDRTLMLLDGEGLELDHGPHGLQRLEGPFRPVSFSGDWTTRGRLLGGPCRDFNVMTARAGARHTLSLVDLGPAPVALPVAPVLLALCLRGRALVEGVALDPLELLELDGPARASAPGGALLAVVRIHYAEGFSSSSR